MLLQPSDTSKISDEERIRLLIFYALRYEKSSSNQTVVLIDALRHSGMSEKKLAFVEDMLKYAGADKRGGMDDFVEKQDILTKTKNVFKGLKVWDFSGDFSFRFVLVFFYLYTIMYWF